MTPFCISITGADDQVDPNQLVALSQRYPFVEWAILVFPEKVGAPRNPSEGWRRKFLEQAKAHGLKTALHLCGEEIFRAILDNRLSPAQVDELVRYDRIQVNINARGGVFTDEDVYAVYDYLAGLGCSLILQRHAGTEGVIAKYLAEHPASIAVGKVAVLFDTSRGRGFAPSEWSRPLNVHGVHVAGGYAGGISPENVETVLLDTAFAGMHGAYWLDMETGVRTDNKFDLDKVEHILAVAARAIHQ